MPTAGIRVTRRASVRHDLRHSLFALRTGIDLLPHVRQDADEFRKVQELLAKEIAHATDLAKLLLEADARQAESDGEK